MLSELRQCNVFADLATEDLEVLSRFMTPQQFPAGAAMVEQFRPAEKLYLIIAGAVTMRYKPYDGPEIVVAHIHASAVVGWSAVLGNATYSSTVVCDDNVQALTIRRTDLRQLVREYPTSGQHVLDHLAKSVSARWKDAQAQVKSMLSEERGLTSTPPQGVQKMALPKATPKEKQMQALVEQLSTYIEQFHGGSVEFVSYDGEVVKVRLGGACLGCPLSPTTLHGWVEGTLRQFFPEVKTVEAV